MQNYAFTGSVPLLVSIKMNANNREAKLEKRCSLPLSPPISNACTSAGTVTSSMLEIIENVIETI